eukprot:scaffold214649_cov37-Prasinocladus_malaysianus.AAC.1
MARVEIVTGSVTKDDVTVEVKVDPEAPDGSWKNLLLRLDVESFPNKPPTAVYPNNNDGGSMAAMASRFTFEQAMFSSKECKSLTDIAKLWADSVAESTQELSS